MGERTDIGIALEPKAVVPLSVLRWWRELVDLNPQDLAPRFDELVARLEAEASAPTKEGS